MNQHVEEYIRLAQKHFKQKVHLAVVADGYRFQLNNTLATTVPFSFNPSMYDDTTAKLTPVEEVKVKPKAKRKPKNG